MIPVDVFLRNHCILLLKRICSHPCCSSPPLCGDAVGTLRDFRPPKGKCSILSIVHCPELAQSGPELHGVPSGRWDSGGLSWGPRTTGYARPGPQVSSLASSSRKLAVLKLGPRASCTCSRSLAFSRPRAGPGDKSPPAGALSLASSQLFSWFTAKLQGLLSSSRLDILVTTLTISFCDFQNTSC